VNTEDFSQDSEKVAKDFNPSNKPLEFQSEAFEVEELEDRIILRAVSRPREASSLETCGPVKFSLGLPYCPDQGTCTGLCGPTKKGNTWYCLCA
jgi:hypothetical protein